MTEARGREEMPLRMGSSLQINNRVRGNEKGKKKSPELNLSSRKMAEKVVDRGKETL